jgi:hypothetical protein
MGIGDLRKASSNATMILDEKTSSRLSSGTKSGLTPDRTFNSQSNPSISRSVSNFYEMAFSFISGVAHSNMG